VLDHLDDLHADFLAIWGIDLHRDTTLTGPEFFELATRTFAFEGVMAARLRAEDETNGYSAPSAQPERISSTTTEAPPTGAREVEVRHMRMLHPDLIDM
jgi:hypothetical protein